MNKVAISKCILLIVIFLIPGFLQAQQTFRTTPSGTIIGYLEHLPPDYHNNSNKYPVVIFLHGVVERGVTSNDPATLQTTISKVTALGPPMHVKNGATMPFILITPQLKDSYGSWPSSYVKEVLDHCKTYLRIDERRIHITGLSMGGHGSWTCIQDMPTVYASAAPVCGANNSPSRACAVASENVAVWAFHGDKDDVVHYSKTTNMVNAINACTPAPNPLAKATIYANVMHNAWNRAYFLDNTYHNPNFYQWVMQQSKSRKGSNYIPLANAGGDKSVTLPTNSVSLTGTATDNGGTISSYKWTQLQGPSTATISNSTSATATASNLVSGTYVFKFTVTDNGGVIDSDFVRVTVNGSGSNTPPVVNAGSDKTLHLPTNATTIPANASDPDGAVAGYSWSKISGGTATISGATTNTLSVSGMAAGSYVFRCTAVDDKGAANSDDVAVIVNNPPAVSAGVDLSISLPTNSVAIQGSASDSDGSISSYAWTKLSGSSATLSGANTSRLTASGLVAGNYIFRLTVTDNRGASKFDDVNVTVTSSGNSAPVANAGPDKVITLPTTSVSFSGSATDPDGTIASYSWTKISGGAATLSGATTASLSVSGLGAGSYIFRLAVTDNSGATDIDDVNLIVNNPPAVNAGADVTIALPTTSTSIQGSASDTDGTIASYEWKKLLGNAVTMSGANTSKLNLSGLAEGSYLFRLTVTDNHGATSIDDVKVTVGISTSNSVPVADAGADKVVNLPANSVTLPGGGTDADGTIVAYSWAKIQGGAVTLSGANTSTATASNLLAGTYYFRLTVTDNSGATDIDDVIVIVNNPPAVNAGPDISINLPTNSATLQGTASDPDGTIVSYQWKKLQGTGGTLSGANSSQLNVSGMVEGTYIFRLTVTDNHGATKIDDAWITVIESAPNKEPVANAGADRMLTLPTNSIMLSGSATDEDGTIASYSWRKIAGGSATLSGENTPTPTASGLGSGTYYFRLTVTDDDGATDIDDVIVVVNASPTVYVGVDQTVTLPANSTTVTATASDPDGTIQSYSWKKLQGPAANLTGENTSTLGLSGLSEGLYILRLTVTDNVGATSIDDVWITVEGSEVNSLPVANAGPDQVITLPSNSTMLNGDAVDSDGTITSYSWRKISGPSATLSNATTKTPTASGLVQGKYYFRLTVTDNNGATDIDDVIVVVNSASTSGTAFIANAEIVDEDLGRSDDLAYNNATFWKDKQVVIYDGAGRRMYSGSWSAENYDSVIETGKLYIFNILDKNRIVKQGKIFLTR